MGSGSSDVPAVEGDAAVLAAPQAQAERQILQKPAPSVSSMIFRIVRAQVPHFGLQPRHL